MASRFLKKHVHGGLTLRHIEALESDQPSADAMKKAMTAQDDANREDTKEKSEEEVKEEVDDWRKSPPPGDKQQGAVQDSDQDDLMSGKSGVKVLSKGRAASESRMLGKYGTHSFDGALSWTGGSRLFCSSD